MVQACCAILIWSWACTAAALALASASCAAFCARTFSVLR